MRRRTALAAAAVVPVLIVAVSVPRGPSQAAVEMGKAARAWLDSLTPELRKKAAFAFDDAERVNWHFVPRLYPGVKLGEMSLEQRRRAHALLTSALSSRGYLKASTVMLLERVLRDAAEARGRRADHRDPERYWFAVFGKPGAEAGWGWRVQGHHLSLNFSCVGGKVAAWSPAFFGANPAEVRTGPFTGLRLLGREEDLARALLASLDEAQREKTVLREDVPADIILGPGRKSDLLGKPKGLAASAMTEAQRGMLEQLVHEYAHALRPDTAHAELERIAAAFDAVHLLWIGSTEPGKPHYFRVHGKTFVIEYDNIQNNANHVHTVWHDLQNDFGVDALRRHHEGHHKD